MIFKTGRWVFGLIVSNYARFVVYSGLGKFAESNLKYFDIIAFPIRLSRAIIRCKRNKYSSLYILDYLTERKLKYRIGECLKCGKCCKGCKYLKDRLCTIYSRRWVCDVKYPVSKEQLDKNSIKGCGYRFREKQ